MSDILQKGKPTTPDHDSQSALTEWSRVVGCPFFPTIYVRFVSWSQSRHWSPGRETPRHAATGQNKQRNPRAPFFSPGRVDDSRDSNSRIPFVRLEGVTYLYQSAQVSTPPYPPVAGYPPKTHWARALRRSPSRLTCKRFWGICARRMEDGLLPCRPQQRHQHQDQHGQQQQQRQQRQQRQSLLDKNLFRNTCCLPFPRLSDPTSLVAVAVRPGCYPLVTLPHSSTLLPLARTPPPAQTPHRKSRHGPNSRAGNLSKKEGILREEEEEESLRIIIGL